MRVLVVCQPGSGHLLPVLPAAGALRDRGHTVSFATTRRFAPSVEAAGFDCQAVGGDLLLADLPARFPEVAPLSGLERTRFAYERVFLGEPGLEMTRDLVRLLASRTFDVVVADSVGYPAACAAEAAGVPYASIAISSLSVDRRWMRQYVALLDRLRAAAGLRPDAELEGPYRHLVLSSVPRFLYGDSDLPPTFHEARLEAYDSDAGAAPDWLPGLLDRRLVYMTLGTIQNKRPLVFRAVADGLAGEDVSLLITTGSDVDPASLEPLPANAVAVRYVPQAALLPHCSVVVSHGGSGTLRGALYFGVPQVLIPFGADQPRNAEICVGLGLARVLDHRTLTPALVREAVMAVLAGGYPERSAAAGARMRAMPGLEEAVRLVEGLVEA